MSRIRFPRVAPRTLPRTKPTRKLPPLLCAIYKDGEFQGYSERPDPREQFCKSFNAQAAQFGMYAVPVMEGGAE